MQRMCAGRKENKEIRQKQSEKIKQLVNFKLSGQKNIMINEGDNIELIQQNIHKRDRCETI